MTKREIIQAIALVAVPDGATLIQHSPSPDVSITSLGSGDQSSLRVMMSQAFTQALEGQFEDLGGVPDQKFFEDLHRECLNFHRQVISACTIDEVAEETRQDYIRIAERLPEISAQLGVVYEQPTDDPLRNPHSE